MKKIVFILIAVTMLFTACNSNSPSSAKHDFRNIDFGMSTIELFEIEGEPDDEFVGDDLAWYSYENKEAFGVKNVSIEYRTDENGVCYAKADFQNEYADNKSYITEYNTVKKNLISAWGEPQNIDEDEEKLQFNCSWENKFLTLNINPEDEAFFQLSVFSNDYLDHLLNRQPEKQNSDPE